MKAIIDLACQSYNLDRAFSQAGYEKKRNADIANLWDQPRILPVLRSSCITK